MKRKVCAVLLLIVASGYVVSLCFRGMNLPDDLFYIGGIVGLCAWFLVVLPGLYKLLTWKRKKHESKVDSAGSSPVAGI